MLAGGLERSGQRNAGDPTFGPHPPLTNPPAAGGAGGVVGTTGKLYHPMFLSSDRYQMLTSH